MMKKSNNELILLLNELLNEYGNKLPPYDVMTELAY